MKTSVEQWATIPEDPRYQVSTEGRVRRKLKTGFKFVGGTVMTIGYRMMAFGGSPEIKHYFHRLVAQAFLPNPENKPTVNHKNLDRLDNRVENLEWATHKENINHARNIYGNYNAVGEQNGKSKLTEEQVIQIKRLLAEGTPQRTIAKQFNISRGPIDGISRGLIWRHLK